MRLFLSLSRPIAAHFPFLVLHFPGLRQKLGRSNFAAPSRTSCFGRRMRPTPRPPSIRSCGPTGTASAEVPLTARFQPRASAMRKFSIAATRQRVGNGSIRCMFGHRSRRGQAHIRLRHNRVRQLLLSFKPTRLQRVSKVDNLPRLA